MPFLDKEIVPENTYLAASPTGRIRRKFSRAYLEKLAETGNSMLAAGLNIPAPFGHSKFAKPETEIELNNKKGTEPFNNAGYWKHFYIAEKDGKPSLKGLADIPGNDIDANTPYYKALNTAKEVSISIHDEFVDGLERKWPDAIMHVALVNHAIVPGQTPFEVPTGANVVNMSMADNDADDTDASLMAKLKNMLNESMNIVVFESMNASNFLKELLVAVSQRGPNGKATDEITPAPIYMSIGDTMIPKDQAEAIVATKAVNPTTKLPFTMKDFGHEVQATVNLSTLATENAELKQKLNQSANTVIALVKKLAADATKSVKNRIDKLVENGLDRTWAEANLIPKAQVDMSTFGASGEFGEHPLEIALSALEMQYKPKATSEFPMGDVFLPPAGLHDTGTQQMSDAELAASINEVCNFVQL